MAKYLIVKGCDQLIDEEDYDMKNNNAKILYEERDRSIYGMGIEMLVDQSVPKVERIWCVIG